MGTPRQRELTRAEEEYLKSIGVDPEQADAEDVFLQSIGATDISPAPEPGSRKARQALAEEVIARQGAAPGVDLEPTGRPSLLQRAGGALRNLGVRGVEVPVVTPALRKATDVAFKPLEAISEGVFQNLTRIPNREDVLGFRDPVTGVRELSEEFRERPILQQLAVGAIDPTLGAGGIASRGRAITRSTRAFGAARPAAVRQLTRGQIPPSLRPALGPGPLEFPAEIAARRESVAKTAEERVATIAAAPEASSLAVQPSAPIARGLLGDPTDFGTQLAVAFNPNNARRLGEALARRPIIGAVLSGGNPTLTKQSSVGRAAITRAQLIDEGTQRMAGFQSRAGRVGRQQDLFGKTVEKTGLLESGPLKGRSMNEIAENPSRFDLSAQQREWLDRMSEMEEELFQFANRNGIKIARTELGTDVERYAGRIHVARVDQNGEIIAHGRIGRGGRLAGKVSQEQARTFTSITEAQQAGFVPLSYTDSLNARAQNIWNRVVNQNMQDWLIRNPGEGVIIRDVRFGETATFGTLRDQMNFPGKVIEGDNLAQFTQEIASMLEPRQAPGFLKGVNKFNAVQRIFALAGDASLHTIQFLPIIYSHPLIWGRGTGEFAKHLTTTLLNPRAARRAHNRLLSENNALIQRSSGLIMSSSGNEFTEAMARGGLFAEGATGVGRITSKLAAPLRPFQRAFEYTMDFAGLELQKGLEVLAQGDRGKLRQVTDYVNNMRGLNVSSRLGLSPLQREIETAVLLAPRYRRATAALYVQALQGGVQGKLARGALRNMAAGVTATFIGITIIQGLRAGKTRQELEDDIKDGLNPAGSRFLLWRFGGSVIGPGSKFVSDARMLGKLASDPGDFLDFSEFQFNPGVRWVRSQLAFAPSSAWDYLTGRSYLGDPIERDITGEPIGVLLSLGRVLKENMSPIWAQSVVFEGGTPEERAARGTGEFNGLRAYRWPGPTLDEISNNEEGVDYGELPRIGRGSTTRRNRVYKMWLSLIPEWRRKEIEERRLKEKEQKKREAREFFERRRR